MQSFTLTVISGKVVITSPHQRSFTAGVAGSFTVTATGRPRRRSPARARFPRASPSAPQAPAQRPCPEPRPPSDSGLYTINLIATSTSGKTSQTFTFSINQPPTITSAQSATETAGTPFSFAVTTRGYPAAIISQTGTLPAGVTFKSNGNGTATIAGTAASGSSTLMLKAATAVGIATQTFTLAVKPAASPSHGPGLYEPGTGDSDGWLPFNFEVTTASSSATKLTRSGALPERSHIHQQWQRDRDDRRHPDQRRPVHHHLDRQELGRTRRPSRSCSPSTRHLRSPAPPPPSRPSGPSSASPSPPAATRYLDSHRPGASPAGLSFTDNGNGTGSIAGTPDAGTGGLYTITITATNPLGTSSQTLALTVRQPPAITSPTAAQATHGTAFSFQFTASGYPPPTLTHTGSVPGLTWANNGNGTSTLSGTPKTPGTYTLSITATNNNGTATQTFTLTVN